MARLCTNCGDHVKRVSDTVLQCVNTNCGWRIGEPVKRKETGKSYQEDISEDAAMITAMIVTSCL